MRDNKGSAIAAAYEADQRPLSSAPFVRMLCVLVLIAWALVVGYVIPRHEPWADEAQAWQMAGHVGLRSLFGHFLHYEGSPGLWHALLWLLVRVHISYVGMHWVAASIALAGAAVLLLCAPFPLALRVVLIFTYFLFYQYAIVARSYVLLAPIMFLLAARWPHREDRPLTIAVLSALLANTSAHGLVISTGLALVLGIEYWQTKSRKGRAWMWSVALWLAAACFAAWCLVPPHDAEWPGGYRQALSPANMPYLLASLPQPQHAWLKGLPKLQSFLGVLLFFRGRLAGPFAANVHLGDAAWFFLAIVCWVHQRKRYLIPVVLLTVFTSVTRFTVYHGGLFWVLFLFLWWVTWSADTDHRLQIALVVIVAGIAISQLAASVQAVRYDVAQPYSPNRDGAKVLQAYLDEGRRVDLAVPARTRVNPHDEYFSVGLEPYFAREPLSNMRARFWIWTHDEDMRAVYLRDVASHSAVVLLESLASDGRSQLEAVWLQQQGYRNVRTVCGQVFYPDLKDTAQQLCHAFYEPR